MCVCAGVVEQNRFETMVVSYMNLTLVSLKESNERPHVSDLIDAGNLVYTYDMVSSSLNEVRPKRDSSEEHDHDRDYKYRKSYDYESRRDYNDDFDSSEEKTVKKSRGRRSVKPEDEKNYIRSHNNKYEKRDDKYDDKRSKKMNEDYTSDESREETRFYGSTYDRRHDFYQPKPTLHKAPETPLLPYFLANNGKSVHHKINAREEVLKLAEEIGKDMERTEEIPKRHTLAKFTILTNILRTMSFEQIKEATRQLIKSNNVEKKTWKAYRDAMVNAGTGPAIHEVMQWIENQHVKHEEAADLIAVMPKTIREPTEEIQKRFFVSFI